MNGVLELTAKDLPVFLLVLFRISGLLFIAPVLGNQGVPVTVKAFFSLVMAIVFFPLVDAEHVEPPANLAAYGLAILWELAVGMLIGFVAGLLFAAIQFAGHVIDQEVGLKTMSILDPITSQGMSIIGQFKVILAMLVYVMIDGHHFLIQALVESFGAVPLQALRFSEGLALHVADTLMVDMLRIGIQIAGPILVTLFLVTVAMAFMARTVPEMNIFILGFALRIGVGFLVLLVGVGLFVHGFDEFSVRHEAVVSEVVRMMGE